MPDEIPKRIIIICFIIVASSLFSIVSGFMSPEELNKLQLYSLPPILSWWTTKTGHYVGLMGNLFSIFLAIMMVMGKNTARKIYNVYFILSAILVTIVQSYITPQVLADQSPEMAQAATGTIFTTVLIISMSFYTIIFMWAINSKKSRKFFQGIALDQDTSLIPDQATIDQAHAARNKDLEE
ncbi:MAG: hypothetical protein CME65_15080 [Halobacteriovoraceae bacterium]|nr:hypothetical protein [Halobacteriovoraceae bacterium]|tara:strand:+ start:17650 stop:18195 length:546 start_codon:yes stop_codon:yes gene_type:complete